LGWYDAVSDGLARLIPPSEMLAWARVTGNVVTHDEYAILRDMGRAWSEAMNEELQYSRARKMDDDRAAAAKAGKRKG